MVGLELVEVYNLSIMRATDQEALSSALATSRRAVTRRVQHRSHCITKIEKEAPTWHYPKQRALLSFSITTFY